MSIALEQRLALLTAHSDRCDAAAGVCLDLSLEPWAPGVVFCEVTSAFVLTWILVILSPSRPGLHFDTVHLLQCTVTVFAVRKTRNRINRAIGCDNLFQQLRRNAVDDA